MDHLFMRLTEIDNRSYEILQAAEGENRQLTAAEAKELEELDEEHKNISRQCEIAARVEDRGSMKTNGRQSLPNDVVRNGQRGAVAGRQSSSGFASLGDLAMSVYRSNVQGASVDPRLIRNAPTTTATEGTGADGGYAVPPDFRSEIMRAVLGETSLLSYANVNYTPSNAIEFPADETTPWQASGGIQAYWESEEGQLTQSKPSLKSKTIKLAKLTALIPVSSELLEDAPGLTAYLSQKVPENFTAKLNTAIVNGSGVGEPQGILNAGCLVSAAKESGQSADTVMYENIVNMWARLYGPCQQSAVWLINQDIYPQLFTMSWEGTSSSLPAYMPANGLAGAPYGESGRAK